MEFNITIPSKEEILSKGIPVSIARANEKWVKTQLGDLTDKSGVYVQHSANEILYVGNTTQGKWGNFAERLRREFQFSSSQNSHLHQLLCEQKEDIKVVMFDLDAIDKMIISEGTTINQVRKALILEQVMIAAYDTKGNRK